MRQELLAPAGSLETFYAVIAAGADAVYLGGPRFSARAYAKNFTEEECIQAIHYAHLKNVKVYMTVNTLVKNNELEECINSLMPYYKAGLDGVIVQDLGVLSALQKTYPGLELHASTQMSVSNKWGALLLKEFGVNRVVPARELSLEEISRIRKEAAVEVETFIHGALCYSFSGNCLMSSLIGGRSGNRGRCAQPCRLNYELLNNKKQRVSENGTLLSLKDLAMLKNLPDLAMIPVDSLKIEGRMKQTEYAYTVVSLYRKYLDQCENSKNVEHLKKNYQVSDKDWNYLLDSGNREGFCSGYYYQHNSAKMVTKGTASHSSSNNEYPIPNDITKPIREKIHGTLFVYANKEIRMEIKYGKQTFEFVGPVIDIANNKPTTKEQILKQMNKTGNELFSFESLNIVGDENIFLPVSVINEFRRNALRELTNMVTKQFLRNDQIHFEMAKANYKDFIKPSLSVGGNIRKHLPVILSNKNICRVYLELDSYDLTNEKQQLFEDIFAIQSSGKECYPAFPYVFRKMFEEKLEPVWEEIVKNVTGFLVRSTDSLGYVKDKKATTKDTFRIIGDQMLYSYSDYAMNTLKELGCDECTIPYELNKKEIEHRNNSNSELVIYGKHPLMITANCVKKTCGLCKAGKDGISKEFFYLKDRKNAKFPVEANCNNCGNVIYNSVPVYLMEENLKMINPLRYRIFITDENENDIETVFALYDEHVLNDQNTGVLLSDITYGHFKRGVE